MVTDLIFFLDKEFRKTFNDQTNMFGQIMAIEGEKFRELNGRRTLRFIRETKSYFIKQHFGIGWKEILKNLFQLKTPVLGASNEWNSIKKLEKIGISTMKMVGYGQRGFNPAKQQSFIITKELTNVETLEDICMNWQLKKPEFKFKLGIITEVANIARKLHTNGINHRDFYLCHFMLDRKTSNYNKINLYLIDLHRCQIRNQIPYRWIVKDIAGLYFSSMDAAITKKDIFRFLKLYFNETLREILGNKKKFLRDIEKRAINTYKKHLIT